MNDSVCLQAKSSCFLVTEGDSGSVQGGVGYTLIADTAYSALLPEPKQSYIPGNSAMPTAIVASSLTRKFTETTMLHSSRKFFTSGIRSNLLLHSFLCSCEGNVIFMSRKPPRHRLTLLTACN